MNGDKPNTPAYTDKESQTSETNEAQKETGSGEETPTVGALFREYKQQLTNTRSTKSFDPSNPPQRHKAIKSVTPSKNEAKDKADNK